MRLNVVPDIDFEYYKNKMKAYEVVFDAVYEDFKLSMFGQPLKTVTR